MTDELLRKFNFIKTANHGFYEMANDLRDLKNRIIDLRRKLEENKEFMNQKDFQNLQKEAQKINEIFILTKHKLEKIDGNECQELENMITQFSLALQSKNFQHDFLINSNSDVKYRNRKNHQLSNSEPIYVRGLDKFEDVPVSETDSPSIDFPEILTFISHYLIIIGVIVFLILLIIKLYNERSSNSYPILSSPNGTLIKFDPKVNYQN